jgi:hypothetical protein
VSFSVRATLAITSCLFIVTVPLYKILFAVGTECGKNGTPKNGHTPSPVLR